LRSESEMMALILNTAKGDDRVWAVYMNGSRANPNAPKDFFQDYDIVYVVKDVGSFTRNHDWVRVFGEIMIMQMPKTMPIIPGDENDDGSFAYLMQFMDGNRIDLTLMPVEKLDEFMEHDSESILLLDKDGLIGPFPPASDSDYIVKKPTAKLYADCCNEFWWVSTYVAKGIWRDELPYAMRHMEYVRDMLDRMVEWYLGIITGFKVSAGKCMKYFKRYLDPETWDKYARTYSDGNYERLWEALFTACDLFRSAAGRVSEEFGFKYPAGDDERVSAHLRHIRRLPRDAKEMY
jgi:aminoglycoside 6-adenylyltransferase